MVYILIHFFCHQSKNKMLTPSKSVAFGWPTTVLGRVVSVMLYT